ncbi:MAG TPA: hypothetical protein VNS81_08515 [Nocardioides sp.]|nr:hypothetical protein [Nocardioides sp.]
MTQDNDSTRHDKHSEADSPEAIEQQKAYGDSSAAVTPDTQQPPQGGGYGDATKPGDGFEGESSRGESAVFEDNDKPDHPSGAKDDGAS